MENPRQGKFHRRNSSFLRELSDFIGYFKSSPIAKSWTIHFGPIEKMGSWFWFFCLLIFTRNHSCSQGTPALVKLSGQFSGINSFISVPNALEILHNRVGDCNEHAVLLAALCRASGIPAQSVTSLGGLIYMTLCIGFIGTVVVLEAGPVYNVFMTGIRGAELSGFQWIWLVGSFSLVLFLCMMTVWIPMRLGERKILERI